MIATFHFIALPFIPLPHNQIHIYSSIIYILYSFYQSYCDYDFEGHFNMRPYQFVIVVGVLIFIHTLITSMYYLLPVNEENEKYIPGLRNFVECCAADHPEQAEEFHDW